VQLLLQFVSELKFYFQAFSYRYVTDLTDVTIVNQDDKHFQAHRIIPPKNGPGGLKTDPKRPKGPLNGPRSVKTDPVGNTA
jgi:hypothetical protein